jgi:hypothetical protein
MSSDPPASKPRRRPSARSPESAKLTFRIPADSAKRFSVHAAMTGQSKRRLFLEMIQSHCTRFVVSDRGPGASASPGDGH